MTIELLSLLEVRLDHLDLSCHLDDEARRIQVVWQRHQSLTPQLPEDHLAYNLLITLLS